jgi:predicted enzyme related to lactoylglutathione lyase
MSSIVHFELPAGDAARAKEFWSSFLGWKFRDAEGDFEYSMTEGLEPVGAVYPAQSGERGPIVYFAVDDMDAALARVGELGGSVELEKQPIPGIGWFARCQDTEGNRFSLFQGGDAASA